MPRLFIAIPLPIEMAKILATSGPAQQPGIRLMPPEQMHITLHFIGEADLDALIEALRSIRFQAFSMKIGRSGQFNRGAILWAGVEHHPELLQLQKAIGRALKTHGFAVEQRAYRPHVTIARCKPSVPQPAIVAYLAQTLDFAALCVREFAIYSSMAARTSIAQGPVYRIEQLFMAD